MTKMKPIWMVLANTVKAHIYEISKDNHVLVKELVHSDSRLKSQDLISDKPGHYQTSHAAHGQFIPTDDAHEKEHKNFSKEISHFLDKSHEQDKFKSLIICAEPHFNGLLKQHLSQNIQKLIIKTLQKDYIPFPNPKLNEVIKEIFQELF